MKRFIDIGANLTDAMYEGVYNGSKKHEPDLLHVLKRSWQAGLQKIIITGGSLSESEKSRELASTDERLFCTVGCHPTRCLEFEAEGKTADQYLEGLKGVIQKGGSKVVAVGECGLDYDRVQFCPIDVQKKYFSLQLTLCSLFKLPVFLHCRNAADDLYEILSKDKSLRGVVHSFDGTIEQAQRFTDLGYYIGLNGCSLKTQENLETVKNLPRDKILLETDCPWCEIRPSHAGSKFINKDNNLPSVKKEKWTADALIKSRNEPCNIRQVLDVVAAVRNETPDELSEIVYENTERLFFTD